MPLEIQINKIGKEDKASKTTTTKHHKVHRIYLRSDNRRMICKFNGSQTQASLKLYTVGLLFTDRQQIL